MRELRELLQVRDTIKRCADGEGVWVLAKGLEDGVASGGTAAKSDAFRVGEIVGSFGEAFCCEDAVACVDDAPGSFQAFTTMMPSTRFEQLCSCMLTCKYVHVQNFLRSPRRSCSKTR